MSNPIPEVRLARTVMNMRVAQAQRDAQARWLLQGSRFQSLRVTPFGSARWQRTVSFKLVALGAQLVAYGLPSYVPATR